MNADKSFEIEFQPIGKRLKVAAGTSIFEAARNAGIELASACGGEGHCGMCQVIILAGQVTSPTNDEEFILTEFERLRDIRLACCTWALSDLKIQIPKSSLITGQRLQIDSSLQEIDPEPLVWAYPLELVGPTLQDTRSDLTRILDGLRDQHSLENLNAEPKVISSAPGLLREHNWRIDAVVRESEIVGFAPPDTRLLGLAADLGTTKIAAYLVDLSTGRQLAAAGAPNPQIGYGEDIISRLNHVHQNPEGGSVLAQKVRQTLAEMLCDLVKQANARCENVVEACVVGNTAMIHLLLELPVSQLAKAPFVAATTEALDIRAERLGLNMAPGAFVHIPPCIGGFVGADHVAMILASDIDRTDKVTLGIDVGTNTEIAIRKPDATYLTSASCASGPAFEGAHVHDGMRAATGAIEKVRIKKNQVAFTTIDNAPAVGLCGSGIVDTVAELYRAGLINKHGRIQRDQGIFRSGERGAEFVLVPAEKSGTGVDIVINQNDINEIQLAKGAIQAGLNILLEITGTKPHEVEEVIIAGAFGSFLNIRNSIAIGLFPDLPNAHYRQVGNAAAIGAKWILISRAARLRAQHIARAGNYHELTTYPQFSRKFALGMLFPDKTGPASI
jgi:uncharacterized 2Fe-2S/4Fe-4S cluster protein (DUF4445 family)